MINALKAALYSRLAGGTVLVSMLGGTSIYSLEKPLAGSYPCVVYSVVSGGHTPTTPHENANVVIRLRALSNLSDKEAGSIRDAVYSLLDRKPLTITGWNNSWIAAEAPHIEFPENLENGKTVFYNGDDYRLLIDKT